MILNKLKTEGIYFRQSDARKVGYYSMDEEGNIKKNEYKISIKDKLNFLAFNKKPLDPISTSYIAFKFYDEELVVVSGSMRGDAVSVAKEIKNRFNYEKRFPYKITENSIIIDYGTNMEELGFNDDGKNITCKLTKKSHLKLKPFVLILI